MKNKIVFFLLAFASNGYVTCVGRLEVVCGSMFSGKSEELIRRLRRAEFANMRVQVFKHSLDDRKTMNHIHAHSGATLNAMAVETIELMREYALPETQVIGIDEVQFFPLEVVELVMSWVASGKHVIVAGLDLDFRGIPFGCMPLLLAVADDITKFKAVCMICGADAHFTQRLVNGSPAMLKDPLIAIGAQECYQARCRTCYQKAA